MYPKLIGICGKKQSGKDTIGDYLIPYGYIKLTFAEPIKTICREVFKLTDEQLHGDKKEEIDVRYDVSPRHLMQVIGTDLFRNNSNILMPSLSDSSIFVHLFKQEYMQMLDKKVVVTDIRFQDEVDCIKKLGGIIVQVKRYSCHDDTHSSENQFLKDVDVIIYNDTSLTDLYDKIDNLLGIEYIE